MPNPLPGISRREVLQPLGVAGAGLALGCGQRGDSGDPLTATDDPLRAEIVPAAYEAFDRILGRLVDAGPVSPGDPDALREELATDLRSVVHENGAPLFGIRQPTSDQLEKGADLTVVVHKRKRPSEVFFHDQEIPGVMQSVEELTATHSAKTKGIFIAVGPDIDPTFSTPVVHTFDITPTLLYSLNLPIAEDFDGKTRVGLFTPEFRAANPLKTIPTWGKARQGSTTASDIDAELVEEFRALGYLD